MDQPTPPSQIEWIDDGVAETVRSSRPSSSSSRKFPVIVAGVACLAIAALGVFTLASHEPVAAPTPTPTETVPPTAVPTPQLDLGSLADPAVETRFRNVFASAEELTLILPKAGSDEALILNTALSLDGGIISHVGLHSYAVDASGAWVAALAGDAASGTASLFVGDEAGNLAKVAEDVLGYAWHATAPGRLAFTATSGGSTEVFEHDVTRSSRPAPIQALDGHLELWGNWGFVLRPDRNDDGFHVMTGSGDPVALDYRGEVIGALNQRLIVNLAGASQSPVFVFGDTGQAWPIFALTDTQFARSVVTSIRTGAVAIQASDLTAGVHEIRLFPPTGGEPDVASVGANSGGLRWNDEGTALYYLAEGDTGGVDLHRIELGSDRRTSLRLVDTGTFNLLSAEIVLPSG